MILQQRSSEHPLLRGLILFVPQMTLGALDAPLCEGGVFLRSAKSLHHYSKDCRKCCGLPRQLANFTIRTAVISHSVSGVSGSFASVDPRRIKGKLWNANSFP